MNSLLVRPIEQLDMGWTASDIVAMVEEFLRAQVLPDWNTKAQVLPDTKAQVEPTRMTNAQYDPGDLRKAEVDPGDLTKAEVDPGSRLNAEVDPGSKANAQIMPDLKTKAQVMPDLQTKAQLVLGWQRGESGAPASNRAAGSLGSAGGSASRVLRCGLSGTRAAAGLAGVPVSSAVTTIVGVL